MTVESKAESVMVFKGFVHRRKLCTSFSDVAIMVGCEFRRGLGSSMYRDFSGFEWSCLGLALGVYCLFMVFCVGRAAEELALVVGMQRSSRKLLGVQEVVEA